MFDSKAINSLNETEAKIYRYVIDHIDDIYSLGVVMYEMLTGQYPYTGETPEEIAIKHINGNLTVSGDMTAGGKPYLSHTHRGDSGGTTSAPL